MANEVSLGDAIGLNYRIPNSNYIADVVGRDIAEGKAAQKAAAAQVARNKKIYDDNVADLNKFVLDGSSGIIPNLQGDIKAAAANVMRVNDEEYAKDPNGYDPNTNKALRAAKYNLSDLHERHLQSSKKVLDAQKEYLTHPEDYDLSPEYDAAFKSGGYNDLLDAINGKNSTERHDIVTGAGILIPKDKTDWYKTTIDSAQNTKPPVVSTEAGGTTVETQRWTPKQKEDLFNAFSTTQNGKLANSAVRQIKAANPSFTDEQAYTMFKNTYIKNIPDVYKQSEVELKSDGTKTLTSADVKTKVPVTIYDAKQKKEIADIADYGVTLPTTLTANIPNAKGIISRDTGKELEAGGKQFVGELNITGSKIYSSKLTKNGKEFYVPVLYATATMLDGEGKTVTKNVEVPLSMLRGDKTIEDNKAGIDELQRKTDELNKSKEPKAGNVQEEWNKKWGALKSGQSMVGLDGKTYKKK